MDKEVMHFKVMLFGSISVILIKLAFVETFKRFMIKKWCDLAVIDEKMMQFKMMQFGGEYCNPN